MQCNMVRIVNATQHKPSYSEGKKPVSLFNMFVVLPIVNASSTSLVVWSLGLETTATLDQSTWCRSVHTCSASGDIDALKSACLMARLCSSSLCCIVCIQSDLCKTLGNLHSVFYKLLLTSAYRESCPWV